MPCDQIRYVSADLGQLNFDVLDAALTSSGWIKTAYNEQDFEYTKGGTRVIYDNGNTKVTTSRYSIEDETLTVKRQYSKQVVKRSAKRYGFNVKQTGENTLRLSKRGL
jgi:hypothetical protein